MEEAVVCQSGGGECAQGKMDVKQTNSRAEQTACQTADLGMIPAPRLGLENQPPELGINWMRSK